ncbi:hypothetical protein SBA2_630018 [Acidobacteriia bacterium SbA2]|nr:hypothetical protein SBA2_630018 [Acidobacteriia bacterium SbA2]
MGYSPPFWILLLRRYVSPSPLLLHTRCQVTWQRPETGNDALFAETRAGVGGVGGSVEVQSVTYCGQMAGISWPKRLLVWEPNRR